MTIFQSLMPLIREYLFASGCALCGAPLVSGGVAYEGLCASCRELFVLPESPRCSLCGRPLISESGVCMSCREREGVSYLDGAFSLFPYEGDFRRLLHAYKFDGARPLVHFLLGRLLENLVPVLPDDFKDAVWIPVPPRPGKMHAQGWDQVDYLVRHLPPKKQTVMRLLKRLKSESQKTLKREERMKNLQGKIVCKKPPVQRVLLLDDVITTGATMEACAFALKEAGSERVFGVSLFYT